MHTKICSTQSRVENKTTLSIKKNSTLELRWSPLI